MTGEAHVRFYAGAVITTRDGRHVGAVCVLDRNPRPRPDEAKLEALRSMAALAADMLERREQARVTTEKLEMLDMAEVMSGVGHWRLEAASGRVTWSDQIYRLHGRDPKTFDPNLDDAVAAYHPDDRAAMSAAVQRAIETGESYDVRLRLIRADGDTRLVRSQGTPQRDDSGKVTAVFGVFQDITDQERTLTRAKRNERRYRLLADNMGDVIARVKPDGHSNYISPAVETVIGYTPMEMVGTTAQHYVLDEDKPIFMGAMAEVLKTGENRRVQYRVVHKSGERVWVETQLQRVENSRGEGEVVIVIRDIRDRKALEDEVAASLAESRKIADRYRLLAENMGDVITRVKADGTSKYISSAIEQLLGWRYKEMSGQSLDYVHAEDRGIVLEAIQQAIQDGRQRTLQHRAVHRDGRTVWLESHFRAMSDESRALGEAVVVMRDISDRKALEAELVGARDRAEAAARAKSEFLANMSHELRTPLTSVVGFAGLMRESRTLGDEERRYVERIAAGSEALLAVINDILDYSKLEAGAVELDPHPFDPLALTQAGVELMEGQCRAKGLELRLETDPDMPASLIGDSGRLRQVLLNFLSNAVKFTAQGGVTVNASCEPGTDGRVWLSLSVKDTGVGVSDDQVEQLFDRFTQADASTTRTFGGTGLGLAISRQLVEMMGGEIGAFGRPGEGSTFWFQVPLPVAELAEECADGERIESVGSARILMADDAPANRELVNVLLTGMGLAVDTVENGAAAVEAVRQEAYDLVLMDVHMPVMDGLDAARVNLVIGWFGDDLRMSHCRIRPGVERAVKPTEPLGWSVAGIERGGAHVVSQAGGGPAYGGTPSDQTVIAAVRELKARGMAVTLYPFVFMDIADGAGQAAYPWRGRISGDGGAAAAGEVAAFFGGAEDWGLRRMARHYAALAAEAGAHGLIVGSELRGVTTLRDAGGGYPAVAELRALAAECRGIAGAGVEISYAADWSEYFGHHPGGGAAVFHLDPLWADPNIDYVGIDWYPPIGDWREGADHLDALAGHAGAADRDYLAANLAGGENFDWFYASDEDRAAQVRTPITDGEYGEPWVWRSKDLKSWWSNPHHDRPSGVRSETPTAWVPGMKPIRLVEFGCAAVDKGANAPNLFTDPKSSESRLPPFSTGARDDLMQRRAMEAWLAHFGEPANNPASAVYGGRMVQGLDAWCWDARPYPDFPARSSVWADAGNWRAGHWLNGRLAGEGRDLIAAILKRGGLDETEFVISGVDGAVAGYVIDRPMRTRDALEPLLFALGAEGAERDGRVAVIGRADGTAVLTVQGLAMPEDGAPLSAARVLETAPDTVRVRFIDETADYQAGSVTVRGTETGGGGLDIDLPAACSAGLAKAVARRALASLAETLTIYLGPLEALRLEPGDAVQVEGRGGVWRAARIELDEDPRAVLTPWVEAGPVEGEIDWRTESPGGGTGAPFLALLDLPPLPGAEDDGRPLAAVAVEPWRAMQVHGGVDADGLTARASAASPATVGRLVQPLAPGVIGRWDEVNTLVVQVEGRAPETRSAGTVMNGANAVAVGADGGWEIVQFRDAQMLGADVWRLSGLLRGQQGTDGEMGAGAGAGVVFLDETLARVEVQPGERGLPMIWRAGPAGAPPGGDGFSEAAFTWRGVHDRPWAPAHLRVEREGEGRRLSWIARTREDGDRWDGETAASDPIRFRVRVLDGETVVRTWEVEDEAADYGATDLAMDFPDGPGEARVAVSQWSPAFGWGVEATAGLG